MGALTAASIVMAHPVLVEGNCDSPVPGSTIVDPGNCGDFDGDGRIGTAEDTDGADRIFGTLAAALGNGTGAAAGTGINLNGTITIVKSGRFYELVNLNGGAVANPGNVTIEAAPGVEAILDAIFQGDPASGNTTRQNGTGITVNMPQNRQVTLRNLTIRNYLVGVFAGGSSRVAILNCLISNNIGIGVLAQASAQVAIEGSHIVANGFRLSPLGSTPSPGAGVLFQQNTTGTVINSVIAQNASVGLRDQSSGAIPTVNAVLFGNNPNFIGN